MFNRNKTAPTLTPAALLSIFSLPPPKLLLTWCVEFHTVLECLFQVAFPLSIPFYYCWKVYPRFAYGDNDKEGSLWGQSSQPLLSPACNLGQRKWGPWCLPQRVGRWEGGELNQKTGYKEHSARFWLVSALLLTSCLHFPICKKGDTDRTNLIEFWD